MGRAHLQLAQTFLSISARIRLAEAERAVAENPRVNPLVVNLHVLRNCYTGWSRGISRSSAPCSPCHRSKFIWSCSQWRADPPKAFSRWIAISGEIPARSRVGRLMIKDA